MLASCAHRGPDASGSWRSSDGTLGLGHRRLAIIDLSPAGRQPMGLPTGNAWIVFNGEIYNHAELRRELEGLGHSFRTSSDTEVILHAHLQWGDGCLPRLRGMFAFALVHRPQEAAPWEVLLARDRLAIKPLYLARGMGGELLFASELQTLLASGRVRAQLDWSAVFDVLHSGSVRQPRTILRGVTALPGGHSCTWKNGELSAPRRWWSLEESTVELRRDLAALAITEQAERLRELLHEVTRYHLIADVPVGVFLSGGIDSGAVAALMAREVRYPIHSFSVGLDVQHQSIDERAAARDTAKAVGTRHFERAIRDEDVPNLFEDFVSRVDQPSEDGANTMVVASLAAEHGMKVVLSGVGMDELLGGYPVHQLVQQLSGLAGVSVPLIPQALRALHEIRPNRYSRAVVAAAIPRHQRYPFLREHIPYGRALRMLPHGVRPAIQQSPWPWPEGADGLNGYLYQETFGYLTNTLLRDSDALTMAASLELRPLFVDHKMVEFCYALPSGAKFRDGRGKAVLRLALKGLVPDSTLARKKLGFGLPKGPWMNGPLKERYLSLLQSPSARDVLSPDWRGRELTRVQSGRAEWTSWTVATLLGWIERHRPEIGP